MRQAIAEFQTERIGHGVRVMEDPSVVALAKEMGTTFEVCITSNYQSGVVPGLEVHPIKEMLGSGLNATLNTDDPSISQIVLSHEYRLANEDLGIPLAVLRDQTLASARAAFLSDVERDQLVEMLNEEYQRAVPGL